MLLLVQSENQPSNLISVSDTLHNPHPLVVRAKNLLERATPNMYGVLSAPWNQSCLKIRVSQDSLHRALCIMDAFVKAVEARGYATEISKDNNFPTTIVIAGEPIKIQLFEKMNRQERSLANNQKIKSPRSSLDQWTYVSSGKLTFLIDEYWSENDRKRWNDNSRKTLEEQLNEIVIGVVVAAHRIKARKIELEEQSRKWKEAEQRCQEEAQRRKMLEMQAEMWGRSQKIRNYLQACEESIGLRLGKVSPDSAEAKWLEWAKDYAAKLDPLVNGVFETMFNPSSH